VETVCAISAFHEVAETLSQAMDRNFTARRSTELRRRVGLAHS
jgi:hypothetical protein